MGETDDYILDAIRTAVWAGFSSPDDVRTLIDDLLDGDADEAVLRAAVGPEFDRKAAAEAGWPATTDCDRLDAAFDALAAAGVVGVQNAGYTMSDGLSDVSEARDGRGPDDALGYCFYHGQDVKRAVAGGELMLAFGSFDDDAAAKADVGAVVKRVFEDHEFDVRWDGDPETRLKLPAIHWQRRYRS